MNFWTEPTTTKVYKLFLQEYNMKNLSEFVAFLEKFNLPESEIKKFVEGKKLFSTMQGNIFLNSIRQQGQNVYSEGLIFVQLKRLLPSKFLLKFLFQNSKNIVEIKTEKQALNFVYGKHLDIGSITFNGTFVPKKFYLVQFEGNVLGYINYDSNEKYQLRNEMNIGEYLKEN